MGENTEAETYLRQCLTLTNEISFVRDVINLLYEYARLRVAQGNTSQAVELLALIVQHPASEQTRLFEGPIRDSAQSLLEELQANLPPEIYTKSYERGLSLELDNVTQALIEAHDP